MDEIEPPLWTLQEHLTAGGIALARIEADRAKVDPAPVCHHFCEADPVDPMAASVEATYRYLSPRFAALEVEFLADRLEAWETVRPDRQWLEIRIPAILKAARASGLLYQGWSWEPRGRQPIGACDFPIINNRFSSNPFEAECPLSTHCGHSNYVEKIVRL